MSTTDFLALLPLLVVGYASVILMVIVTFKRGNSAAYWLTLATLASAFGAIFIAGIYSPRSVTPLIRVDDYSLYFDGLILVAAFFVTMFSRDYMPTDGKRAEPFYVLILMAVLGMLTVASSGHFASFFLGFEILSVSLYGLIGYIRKRKISLEAAIKYLILAAAASAFLLFGIALVYSEYGTMEFAKLVPILAAGNLSTLTYLGMALIIVGFGFKLTIVPFHMWSPDVYQGAPVPITMLIASGSKAAVFALLLRLVAAANLTDQHVVFVIITALAVATMFTGNLLALMQNNVKRLLAYSSIAQIGYLLIPLAAGGTLGASSIAFYLVSYVATTIVAFGVIAIISGRREQGDLEHLSDYRGLSARRPYMAAIFAISLLSLTGIPLTSGFFAKLFIFSAAVKSGLWWLVIIGVLNTGISGFYYMRVVFTMYAPSETIIHTQQAKPAGAIALGAASAAVVFFGVYPVPLLRLAEAAVRNLGFR
ncbi:MAG: NADH-quinone oxidoreductase subunit N [Armatimonadota bacterium]